MGNWRQLLEDRDAERAWKVIDDIAQALRPYAENLEPETDPSVTHGTAGWALFYAYLGAETGSEEWTGLARRLMEYSIDALSQRPLLPDFYEGFTGIGWAIDHLQGLLFEEADDDSGEPDDDPIGESLVQVLGRSYSRGDFDLIGGLSGYGIYAFHALPRPAARRSLELLVERLIEIGEPVDGGFSWFTPPETLPDWLREQEPMADSNIGVSHGVAAVTSVLGMCAGAACVRRAAGPSSIAPANGCWRRSRPESVGASPIPSSTAGRLGGTGWPGATEIRESPRRCSPPRGIAGMPGGKPWRSRSHKPRPGARSKRKTPKSSSALSWVGRPGHLFIEVTGQRRSS